MKKDYDDGDLKDIIRYSEQLKGKSFLQVLEQEIPTQEELQQVIYKENSSRNKGELGVLLEKYFYGYEPNSRQEADFPKVGLELKVTPYEKLQKQHNGNDYRAGERLVITKISYAKQSTTEFDLSDLSKKISKMLVVWYLRDRDKKRLNYCINYVYYYDLFSQILATDLAVIREDFQIIIKKIIAGLAHELSESDTRYLGACTKGSTAEKSLQTQYYNPEIKAKGRAFCLKQSYMTYVLNQYVMNEGEKLESIFSEGSFSKGSFDDEVLAKINVFMGMSEQGLYKRFDLETHPAKQKNKMLVNRMLGINTDAAEFRKANILVKTIRVKHDGNPCEAMSFANVQLSEFAKRRNGFEESTVYQFFEETRFLFVIFRQKEKGGDYILSDAMFWSMPFEDLNITLRKEWRKYVNVIAEGVVFEVQKLKNGKNRILNNLPGESELEVFHLRPKAQHAAYLINNVKYGRGKDKDMDRLPNGDKMTRQCFWLNKSYIKKIISRKS